MTEQQARAAAALFRNEPPPLTVAEKEDRERREYNVRSMFQSKTRAGRGHCRGLGCGKIISGNKEYCADCWQLQQVADTFESEEQFLAFVATIPEADRVKVAEKMKPMLPFQMSYTKGDQ